MIVASKDFHKDVLVSVVMLAFNHEKYIHQSINSIICQQTNFQFEIIIGEDCSSDRTKEICLEFQRKYPEKIKLILHETNQGLIGNYKAVLNESRGKYIAVCACDDYWTDENKLQKHFDYLEKNSDVVVTYHDVQTIDEDGNLLQNKFLTEEYKRNFTADELMHCVWIIPLSMCFRSIVVKELVTSINNKVFLEDVFTISIFGNYGSGGLIDSSAAYRFSLNSIWSMQRDSKKKLMQTATYGELFKYYKEKKKDNLHHHFLTLFRSGMADSLHFELNQKEVKLFITLLWRYSKYLTLKDFLYYNKYILTKYSYGIYNK
jgi:glycosyltransferase involved in cell wall biosynthesis